MCFSDGCKQRPHERYLLFSQSVPLKCYHTLQISFCVWWCLPHSCSLDCNSFSSKDHLHLWKTLKARTAFFLTDSYLLYIVSSVSQSWLIFFAYISLFQLAWLSVAVLLNVGIQWFLVCLLTQLAFFSGTPVFFKLFALDFFSRAGNIKENTNQEKKNHIYLLFI